VAVEKLTSPKPAEIRSRYDVLQTTFSAPLRSGGGVGVSAEMSGVDGGWLGGAADVWIYGDVPLFQQPFGDVEPIPVLFAPPMQFGREDICLLRQSQVPDLQFEFGSDSGGKRHGMPPVGIATLAHCGADGGWS
jgi:hypothetical protein